MTRIALDAMGGDHAPQETVRGALDAAARGVDVVLVGDEARLRPLLAQCHADLPIVHAPEAIGMGDDVSAAIRDKRRSSISVAARLVAEGEAAGLVSAGSTGATVAAGVILVGRAPGVSRPALAAIFPVGHPTVVLDVGANLEVRPEHLVQFAVMGRVLAQVYLGADDPAVGLLNIGEEEGKGRPLEKEAYALLAAARLHFVGNVEGRDLGRGTADVFVTDGFTGNVALKVSEGLADAMLSMLKREIMSNVFSKIGFFFLKRSLKRIKKKLDYAEYGGALLLGVNGIVIIGHGSSNAKAIKNAVYLSYKFISQKVLQKISLEIEKTQISLPELKHV